MEIFGLQVLNISFSGYPYPSKAVQNDFRDFCEAEDLEIITQDIANSALHIVLVKIYCLENL